MPHVLRLVAEKKINELYGDKEILKTVPAKALLGCLPVYKTRIPFHDDMLPSYDSFLLLSLMKRAYQVLWRIEALFLRLFL